MSEQNSTYNPAGTPLKTSADNPHVRALADAFEMMFASKAEARELAQARIPKNLTVDVDGKIHNARELVLSEGIANTPLVQIQYYNTMMEGAKVAQIARQAFRSERMSKGNTLRLPFQSQSPGRAPEVPEAAPYRNSNNTYTYRDFTIKKYGEVAPITDEMISDSLFNTMAMEVAGLGEHCENSLNYEMIGVILQNSGKEHDTAGSNQGIKAIAKAKLALKGFAQTSTGGFAADTIVATTEFESVLNQELILTNYWGGQMVTQGQTPPTIGMPFYATNCEINASSYTWGYDTDGDIGALVFNRQSAGAYVMREDITIEDFREPLQDLTGAKAKIRFGVNYGIANATCRIEY
jgi:hypothetical protein